MIKGKIYLTMFATAALAGPATSLGAYEIGSGSKAKKGYNLHESFTAAAQKCLEANDGTEPGDCLPYLSTAISGATESAKSYPVTSLPYSARWPDDPVRMLDRDPSKLRFGLKLYGDCAKALERGPSIDRVGLLCSSHYGRLQFMHAQVLSFDAGRPRDPRALMLAWAGFAFDAATNPRFRAMNFCDAVKTIAEPQLRVALQFSDETWCHDDRRGFVSKYGAWKVSTLFSLSCRNPLQEKTCWLPAKEEDIAALTSRAATGALLHLIQDSFSQSHVARPALDVVPGARGPFVAAIVCRKPAAWYDYNIQNLPVTNDEGRPVAELNAAPVDPHGVADRPPLIDRSCEEPTRTVDDPVTASARVMWYVAAAARSGGNDPALRQRFLDYLGTRVFPR